MKKTTIILTIIGILTLTTTSTYAYTRYNAIQVETPIVQINVQRPAYVSTFQDKDNTCYVVQDESLSVSISCVKTTPIQ